MRLDHLLSKEANSDQMLYCSVFKSRSENFENCIEKPKEERKERQRELRQERSCEEETTSRRTQESEARKGGGGERDQAKKSVGRMPRHQEPKKDAVSGETRRGEANNRRSADVRMGKPGREKPGHCRMNA